MQNTRTTAGETAIQKFTYEGSPIAFANGESVMVNATQMAKKFRKQVTKWLNTQQTNEFLKELSEVRKCTSADLVQVRKGGDPSNQGTWMHEDVAMEFARWLSPKFAIWCNDRIKELVRSGITTLAAPSEARTDDEVIAHAMQVLQRRLDEKQAQLEAANGTIAEQRDLIAIQDGVIDQKSAQLRRIIPLAQYAQTAIESGTATYTMTQVSDFLGFARVADFLDWTVRLGILHRLNGRWMPTAAYLGRSMFTTRVYRRMVSSYQYEENYYTVVTEAGRKALYDMMGRYTDPHAAIEADCEVVEMEGGAL